jgi:hypothetical protein
MKDWVFITFSFTVPHRRPIVKRLSRFSGFPVFSAAFPSDLIKRQWLLNCRKDSLFQKGQDYSGVAVPDFHRVPF